MRRRAQPILWCACLVLTHLGLTAAADALPAPPAPWAPARLAVWVNTTDADLAAFSILRIVGLLVTWYLLAVTVAALLGRCRALRPLAALADIVTVPPVRRLVHHLLGVGLAASIAAGVIGPVALAPGVASAAAPAGPAGGVDRPSGGQRITMQVIEAEPSEAPPPIVDVPGTMRMTVVDESDPDRSTTATTTAPAPLPTQTPTTTTLPPTTDPPTTDPPTPVTSETGPPPTSTPSTSGPGQTTPTATPTVTSPTTDTSPTSTSPPAATIPPTTPSVVAAPTQGPASPTVWMRVLPPPAAPAPSAPARPTDATDATDATEPAPSDMTVATPTTATTWTIAPGDHLWHVAETTLGTVRGRPAPVAAVAAYLDLLIDQNREVLAVPGQPDLVFPGQTFALPPVPHDLVGAA